MESQRGTEDFSQMETSMKENGKKDSPMDAENTFMKTVPSMKANGLTTNNMEKEKRRGEMDQTTKGSIETDKNTGKEPLNGLMVANILAISKKIFKMDRESILGKMEESMMDNG